jgi:hypothetical protein
VAEPLEFERGAAADDKSVVEQRLQRQDDKLPVKRAARAAIDAATRPSGNSRSSLFSLPDI